MADTKSFDQFFERTLDDGRLSRGESSTLKSLLSDLGDNPQHIAQIRSRASEVARGKLDEADPGRILDWVEDVVKALHAQSGGGQTSLEEAYFFPEDAARGLNRLVGCLRHARKSLDICVFTITHNALRDEVIGAHKRGVAVRVLTDNDKAYDLGSDIRTLEGAGVAVRIDKTKNHMHHKFALVDGRLLINGSFNWTRSASRVNQENLQLSNSATQLRLFQREFERLWRQFG